MTDRRQQLRVVLTVFVLIGSVIAIGGVGFIGSVSADVTALTGYQSGTDGSVEIGQTSETQDVAFNVTIDGSQSTENVTLNVSSAIDNGSTVTIPGGTGDISLNDTSDVSVNDVVDETGSAKNSILLLEINLKIIPSTKLLLQQH